MVGERGEIDWRQPVLESVMRWSVRLGAIVVLVLVLSLGRRAPARLFEPGFLLMFGAYLCTVWLGRWPGLEYRHRAMLFCALLLAMSSLALYNVGGLPGPIALSVLVVVAAQLFLGRTAMLAYLALGTASVVLFGDRGAAPGSWVVAKAAADLFPLRLAVGFALPTASLALLVSHVVGKIEHSLLATSEALRRLGATERERLQAQEALARTEDALLRSQKLEAVGRLAAGVGHDFNNTLQVVLSWTSLLRDESDPKVFADGLDALEQAAVQGSELTQRLLAFGRRDVRAPAACSPVKLIEDSAKSLRRLLPEDISIELDLDASAPQVLVDAAQISHVLLNLGVNARDAMPAGGILRLSVARVSISELPADVAYLRPGVEFVELCVRDSGTGMSAETRAHLFEPFYTTKGERGSGLGLATAYAIMQRNGGAIRVQSELGRGSSFHLYLPEHIAPAEALAVPARVARRSAGATVMIAEDDNDVRQTMARVLSAAGYRVLESPDAASAMALLDSEGDRVDVLCTDGVMPGGGTRALIDRYKARRPSGHVIVCSGYVQEELLRRDIDAGAYAYLPKPFLPGELVARIDTALAGKPAN